MPLSLRMCSHIQGLAKAKRRTRAARAGTEAARKERTDARI